MNYFKNVLGNYFLPLVVALLYVFLYLPMFVLTVFSFNSVAFPYRWVSFSWCWYQELFESAEIWQAFTTSLIVATIAVLLSVSLGVLFVFYSAQNRLKHLTPLFYGNVIIPEIVIAVSLLSFFSFFSIQLGIGTLIAGHTLLGLGFAVPILHARFAELDYNVIEASLDLGATLNQTFVRVILPMLSPAIVASALLVFIISFDDFLISFFCAGSSAQTLSLYIFAMIRTGVTPTVNALSTLLLLLSSLFVLVFCSLKTKIRIF